MAAMESLWTDLMTMQVTPLDKIIRTVVVYLALLLLLRFFGQRIMAQMNSLDLVVVLLLSNVVQNAIIGADNSLLGGLIGAVVLIGANQGLDRLAERWEWLRQILEGPSTTLITDGQLDVAAARRMGLVKSDIAPALRNQGADAIEEVKLATLNPDGSLVVNLRPEAQSVTRSDLDEALARLRTELVEELRGGVGHSGPRPSGG